MYTIEILRHGKKEERMASSWAHNVPYNICINQLFECACAAFTYLTIDHQRPYYRYSSLYMLSYHVSSKS